MPFQMWNMLLKSNYYVENLEIPESGPELPPPALTLTKSVILRS